MNPARAIAPGFFRRPARRIVDIRPVFDDDGRRAGFRPRRTAAALAIGAAAFLAWCDLCWV